VVVFILIFAKTEKTQWKNQNLVQQIVLMKQSISGVMKSADMRLSERTEKNNSEYRTLNETVTEIHQTVNQDVQTLFNVTNETVSNLHAEMYYFHDKVNGRYDTWRTEVLATVSNEQEDGKNRQKVRVAQRPGRRKPRPW
jgi:hypothetical protein